MKNIASKIEEMLKDRIKELGLVKTGRLLNSIQVIMNDDYSFKVIAEDYFPPLDEEYDISSSVLNSDELASFIEEEIYKQLNNELE